MVRHQLEGDTGARSRRMNGAIIVGLGKDHGCVQPRRYPPDRGLGYGVGERFDQRTPSSAIHLSHAPQLLIQCPRLYESGQRMLLESRGAGVRCQLLVADGA